MGRHVKEEKVDDDPEQENLDEIEDVNGVKTKRLEVRFEKKRQASGQNQNTEMRMERSSRNGEGWVTATYKLRNAATQKRTREAATT